MGPDGPDRAPDGTLTEVDLNPVIAAKPGITCVDAGCGWNRGVGHSTVNTNASTRTNTPSQSDRQAPGKGLHRFHFVRPPNGTRRATTLR